MTENSEPRLPMWKGLQKAARSTLITSCYAPRLGVSFHRKLEVVPLPEGLNMFPAYLRQAGYHTSNAAKTGAESLSILNDLTWIKENFQVPTKLEAKDVVKKCEGVRLSKQGQRKL